MRFALMASLAACAQPGRIAIRTAAVSDACAAVGSHDVVLATKAGAHFDRDARRADLHTATRDLAGYAIAFELTPPRLVTRVELDGITPGQLPRLSMLEGTLDDRARLARLVVASEDLLRDHGYLDASLRATTRDTCDGVIVRVTGRLGRQYHVRTLRVIGATIPVSRADLEDDLGHANVVGGVYWKTALDDALARMRAREKALGHLDARGELDVALDAQTASVDVVMSITEGPRYRLKLVVEGGTPEMRALVTSAVAPIQNAPDRGTEAQFGDAARAEIALDRQLAKLGGQVSLSTDRSGDIFVVKLVISPLATAGVP
jgi:hypothetical protein